MVAPVQPGWYPDRSGASGIAVVTLQPQDDPFYSYTGPLDGIAPGTVLNTRTFRYHLFGFPTLLETTQLLYRSTSQTGKPTVNVTSIIKPPIQFDEKKVVSSTNPPTTPSTAMTNRRMRIWGGLRLGGAHPQCPRRRSSARSSPVGTRSSFPTPRASGRTSPRAPVYGMNTLDSIRAAVSSSTIPSDAKVAMLGYSGGAIATEWAAELAPTSRPTSTSE